MFRFSYLLSMCLAIHLFSALGVKSLNNEFTVSAYLPELRFEGANFDTICSHVHDLIFFSLEPSSTGEIAGLDRFPAAHVLADAKKAADKFKCKLLICFGGNGRSSGFSAMTRNRVFLKKFVANVAKLIDVGVILQDNI